MPIKLVVVFILWGLGLALDLYAIGATSGVADYIRIGLNVVLVVGLLRGAEWARMLAKVVAVLSLLSGGLLLISLLSLGAFALGTFAYATVGLVLVYGAFLLWCMNQTDVQEWLMSRQMRE